MPKSKITTKQRAAVLRDTLRELGRLGGKASAAALTPAQRHARAVKAGKALQAQRRSKVLAAKAEASPRLPEKKAVVSPELASTLTRDENERAELADRLRTEKEECEREKRRLECSDPKDKPALIAAHAREVGLLHLHNATATPKH